MENNNKLCAKCNYPMEHKEGISKKTNKPYNLWICTNWQCKNMEWINTPKTLKESKDNPDLNPLQKSFDDMVKELKEINERLDKIEIMFKQEITGE